MTAPLALTPSPRRLASGMALLASILLATATLDWFLAARPTREEVVGILVQAASEGSEVLAVPGRRRHSDRAWARGLWELARDPTFAGEVEARMAWGREERP